MCKRARLCSAGACKPCSETSLGPRWGDATAVAHTPLQPACLSPGTFTPSQGRVPSCAHRPSQHTSSWDILPCAGCGCAYGVRAWGHAVPPLSLVSAALQGATKCGSSGRRGRRQLCRGKHHHTHPVAGSGGELELLARHGGLGWVSPGGGAVTLLPHAPGGTALCRHALTMRVRRGTGWRGASRRDGVTPWCHRGCIILWQ